MQIQSGTYERQVAPASKYISNTLQAFEGTIIALDEGESSVKKTPFLEVTFANDAGATCSRRYYTSPKALVMLYELADHAGIANPAKGFNTKKLLNKRLAVVMTPPTGTGRFFEARTKATIEDAQSYVAYLASKVTSMPTSEVSVGDDVPF